MLASPEERQRAALLLNWLFRQIDGVEYRYEICLFAWPTVEGFSVSDTIAGPIGLLPCKMPGADGLVWVSPTGGRLELRKVDSEDRCTLLGYTDAPHTVSHMCVDPLSGCLVLVDNTRRLLYLVFEWESRDAPLAIAEPQGHRIRPVLEAERVGALFSACCCGDGFLYCLSLTEDAEGVVRIDVRDDSLVATSHEGTTELLWVQTQLKRNPESELVLWTSAVGRRTVTTVDFAAVCGCGGSTWRQKQSPAYFPCLQT
ncbi:hypothetical protein FOZ62_015178 [Perkinsus olseni]|uniref:Uncharacterized protein n=1 Tax=Perkinsus olseni TaxID=32597 RepID=A0A7J6NI48_PEROL|nr:hypothetical protein FOZ62_015178 [Perkinsus olseni]